MANLVGNVREEGWPISSPGNSGHVESLFETLATSNVKVDNINIFANLIEETLSTMKTISFAKLTVAREGG